MRGFVGRWLKRIVATLAIVLLSAFAVRVYDVERGPPLEPWHVYVPQELTPAELGRADWQGYLKAEQAIFESVRAEVTRKLDPEDRVPVNRYFEGSPVHPARFAQDWNRSFLLLPEGRPLGAAVFLHGLTDAPYSLRHIAQQYRDRGFIALAIRLPGHGTVPAGLTEVDWEDWLAAAHLAMREARRLAGEGVPLHLVGYSNGGALALMQALDALENPALPRPDRLVLMSPMVGVTAFARFAGLAGLPAILPAFAKAAWLSILPEFNPFKYNSFPVNAARQSHLLSSTLQERIQRLARENRLGTLAPVLTFQSVMDATVSTRAVVTALYDQLPANGSELVLFDINRSAKLSLLLSTASDTLLSRLLTPAPRRFRVSVVTNADPAAAAVVERVTEAGATAEAVRDIGLDYPLDVYSLSHVALPFPVSDGLYGTDPDPRDDFGIRLGAIASRGERGTLIMDMDALMRMSSNPFHHYLAGRIDAVMAGQPAQR